MLLGIGEEGGGPIYVQAQGLRGGRPPRSSFIEVPERLRLPGWLPKDAPSVWKVTSLTELWES